MSEGKDKEANIVLELAKLLRKNGEWILRGESKLALTTQSLSILNRAFRRYSESETSDQIEDSTEVYSSPQWRNSIRFLQDFLQRASSVKIIHGPYTMQAPVKLARFRNLQVLEIKKVPIHMLEGLQHIRAQLTTIIIARSLQTIHELFETCGGDMSAPMTWPELKSTYLSHNSISKLDTSLRLLQALVTIDLSHNIIEKTETHLECLTGLIRINLGYNYLEHLPSFSLTTKGKLKTLVLRNNNLDHIEGLEDLIALEELDLSDNCLTYHSCLHVLSGLHSLSLLCLQGNPLSYHHSHRKLAVKHLSPFAGKIQFILDDKALSASEWLILKKNKLSMSQRPSHKVHTIITRVQVEDGISGYYSVDESDGIATSVPLSQGQTSLSRKKSKRKLCSKSSKSDISDLDSSALDASSRDSSRAPSPSRSLGKTKEEYEILRDHYGPNWLQIISAKHHEAITTAATIEARSPQSSQTEDDIYMNDSQSQVPSSPTDHLPSQPTDGQVQELPNDSSQKEKFYLQNSRNNSFNKEDSEEEQDEILDNESEPFIVLLDTKDHIPMIVTITDRYLVEKNLNGNIVEKLDLKCLEMLSKTMQVIHNEDQDEDVTMPVIKLKFDYVKKDRRERSFAMEDSKMAVEFEELLKPFLQIRELEMQLQGLLQCLKCSNHFNKKIELPGSRRSSIAINNEESGDRDICPKCQSEMVVKVDLQHSSDSHRDSLQTAPGGFYTGIKKQLNSRRASLPVSPIGSISFNKREAPASSTQKSSLRRASLQPASEVVSKSNKENLSSSLKSSDFMSEVPLARSTPLIPRKTSSQDLEVETPEMSSKNWSGLSNRSSNSAENVNGDVQATSIQKASSGMMENNQLVPKEDKLQKRVSSWSEINKLLSAKGVESNTPSVDSDITILTNPSDSSVVVVSEPSWEILSSKKSDSNVVLSIRNSLSLESIREHNSSEKDDSVVKHSTPLSDCVRDSIVSSIYETSLSMTGDDSAGNVQFAGEGRRSEVSELSIYDATCVVEEDNLVNDQLREISTTDANSDIIVNSSEEISDCRQDESKHSDDIDFTKVDHRIKLHLMMSLLEDGEECLCMLKCNIVQYMVMKEISGIMIVTSKKILIFKVSDHSDSESLDHWLQCIENQPITELQYIDIGVGYQSLRLEFSPECSCFTLLIRDEGRCKTFVGILTGVVQGTAFSDHSKLQGISKFNQATMENLQTQVLERTDSPHDRVEEDKEESGTDAVCTRLVKYLTGHLIDSEGDKCSSSFVISPLEICLVYENYQWPLPRLQAPMEINDIGPQFTVKERQKINNIATVEVCEEDPKQMRLTFFNEESQQEVSWNVAMETVSAVTSLVESVREPWEAEFGVELDVTSVSFS